ncbi:MAG: hypothetical protein U9Q69_01930 [Nanoarchaeota archaeon]|nr:hypothetical protein [Nanoarchaeota archaeon]
MGSATLTILEETKNELSRFAWVNWSEVSREATRKKEIFEKFIKGIELSKEEEEFCEETNWDPLDEMEVKEEFIEKLKKIEAGPHHKMTLEKLDKLLGLK